MALSSPRRAKGSSSGDPASRLLGPELLFNSDRVEIVLPCLLQGQCSERLTPVVPAYSWDEKFAVRCWPPTLVNFSPAPVSDPQSDPPYSQFLRSAAPSLERHPAPP